MARPKTLTSERFALTAQAHAGDSFVLVRKRREYTTSEAFPKIRIDRATYDALAAMAAESDQPMTEITRQCVAYAVAHLKWADEAPTEEAPE